MPNLSINSLSPSIFKVNAADVSDKTTGRANMVAAGRILMREHLRKGTDAINAAIKNNSQVQPLVSDTQYKELNEQFRNDHLVYAAKKYCEAIGGNAPENFEQFRAQAIRYYGDPIFYKILQGIYEEIVTPILPTVYSTAVAQFADVVEVGFGETAEISVGSNDIPVFQDSAWGASRSVPRNRFYSKDFTLNPQPKTAEIGMKYTQLIGNGTDFGQFFANLAAGMYAKTMGMWNTILTTAASDTSLVPSGLTYAFSNVNWVTLANKIAALNGTTIDNLLATGNAVALSKVLPANATGSTNTDMDAALAMLLGRDYIRSGYLGEFMRVRLLPQMDAIVPGSQYGAVNTILDSNKIWMMAANGRKPMTIAYNRDVPITIEIDPIKNASFEMVFNITTALDSAAVFSSKVGLITI